MASRVVVWGEVVVAFLLLYVGIPWTGLQVDRLLQVPSPSAPLRWIGVPLVALGVAGLAWCFALFVRLGGGTPNPLRPPERLVTRGPFAWTRNPITLSHAAALFGVSLLVGSWSAVGIVAVLSIPIHFGLLREERTLESRFGDAYRAYRERVPRWIPRPPRGHR